MRDFNEITIGEMYRLKSELEDSINMTIENFLDEYGPNLVNLESLRLDEVFLSVNGKRPIYRFSFGLREY